MANISRRLFKLVPGPRAVRAVPMYIRLAVTTSRSYSLIIMSLRFLGLSPEAATEFFHRITNSNISSHPTTMIV